MWERVLGQKEKLTYLPAHSPTIRWGQRQWHSELYLGLGDRGLEDWRERVERQCHVYLTVTVGVASVGKSWVGQCLRMMKKRSRADAGDKS